MRRLCRWSLPQVCKSPSAACTIHRIVVLGWHGFGTSKKIKKLPQTTLLVDADVHSVEEIRQAISRLKDEGGLVRTKIFAEPARQDNKKWGRLIKEQGVAFCPVHRATIVDHAKQPNDEAITLAMQELSGQSHSCHDGVALLTSDLGFLVAVLKAQASGLRMTVVIPEYKYSTLRGYNDSGVKVLELETGSQERGSRVRAILHTNGDGSVKLVADAYRSFDNTKGGEFVRGVLQELGYATGKYLTPACAKFWFAHGLGSLVVFPDQLSTLAVQKAISQSSRAKSWKRYNDNLAFFAPTRRVARSGTYGSILAHSIFLAGGPFMLKDSPLLVSQALRRLGYLDDEMNADESEAMFNFVNVSANKVMLRMIGILPCLEDSSAEVREKLRVAFLSHESRSQWQMLGGTSERVQQILLKEKLLANSHFGCSSCQILDAMKAYVKKFQLEHKKTFNALARVIIHHSDKSPSKRAMIEFKL